jgi:hypothetical protein
MHLDKPEKKSTRVGMDYCRNYDIEDSASQRKCCEKTKHEPAFFVNYPASYCPDSCHTLSQQDFESMNLLTKYCYSAKD